MQSSAASQHRLTPTGRVRSTTQAEQAAADETARRWRSLVLVLKALLIAVEEGLMDTGTALLPWTVLPDGNTLGQRYGNGTPALEAAET
jgi:hypothetical protein